MHADCASTLLIRYNAFAFEADLQNIYATKTVEGDPLHFPKQLMSTGSPAESDSGQAGEMFSVSGKNGCWHCEERHVLIIRRDPLSSVQVCGSTCSKPVSHGSELNREHLQHRF